MKILHRYLLKHWFYHFLLSFCVINVLLLIGNLIKFGSKVGILPLIPLLPALLPSMLIYCLPIASLTSTVSMLIRSRRSLEPIIMASSGLSIFQMMPSIMIMGFLLSLLTGVCFEWIQPAAEKYKINYLANLGTSLIENEIKKDQATLILGDSLIYLFDTPAGKSIVMQQKKNGLIKNEIFADNCDVWVDQEAKGLRIQMKEAIFYEYEKGGDFKTLKVKDVSLPAIQFPEKIPIKKSYREQPLSSMWKDLNTPGIKDYNKRKSYFYEKVCLLFSCILLIGIAFPLAFTGDITSPITGFVMALGVIFLIYYPILILGKKTVQSGHEPAWIIMQTPNLALIALICVGFTRMNRKV